MTQEQMERPPIAGTSTTVLLHQRDDEPATTGPGEPDPALLDFLHDRLCEEIITATWRRDSAIGEQAEAAERGLALLNELVLDLKHGRGIDSTSLKLLALAYGKDPRFRPEWQERVGTTAG